MKPNNMDKWLFRQNARRAMQFGVEMPITYGPVDERKGISNRRHYAIHNPEHAKHMARENIEVLKAMRSEKFKRTQLKLREQAVEFYSKLKKGAKQ